MCGVSVTCFLTTEDIFHKIMAFSTVEANLGTVTTEFVTPPPMACSVSEREEEKTLD